MTAGLAFLLKAVIFMLYLCMCNLIYAEPQADRDLIIVIKGYFENYYKDLSEKGPRKSKTAVINELGTILGLENIYDIGELNDGLNSQLSPSQRYINIFALPGEDKLQCWIGQVTEERNKARVIWGREIKYAVRKMSNLIVHDYVYFSTNGNDALDAGVIGNTVYYNLEAYFAQAEARWKAFSKNKARGSISRPYDSLGYNRLRRKLRDITWRPLYLKSIRLSPDLNKAHRDFLTESVELMTNASLFHELGHIYYSLQNNVVNDIDSEVTAFLTELRYSPLPHESLDRVVCAAYSSFMKIYRLAGREILAGFVSYIQSEQAKGNKAYKRISVGGKRLSREIKYLYKLTDGQIREISEYIYKLKCNEG
jgi:hypothetical protein